MKLISRILILILACMMLLTSCEIDEKNEENKPTATVEVTEAAKETAKETATIEPTASILPTESLPTTETTQTPVTEPTENPTATEVSIATTIPTVKPTVQPTVTVEPTKIPTIIVQPTEKPTVKPTSTTKPTESPSVTTSPTEDPSVDYSKWGKHGFESLLPIPLPFSDEEADWISKKDGSVNYNVKNNKKIRLENPDDFIKIFKEYVESFEAYCYRITCEQYSFAAQLRREQVFYFQCEDGYIIIDIYYRS